MSADTENHVNGDAKPSLTVLQPRRRLWLFSMPRTASNLFVQMMKGHSNTANVEYEFMYGAFFKTMGKFDLGNLSEGEQAWIRKTFDEAFNTVITKVEAAENDGKTVFAKEHILMCLDRRIAYKRIHTDEQLTRPDARDSDDDKKWTLHMPGETDTRQRTNISMLPDDFLKSWLPVFLIRHPALVIPSQYRVYKKAVTDDPLGHESTALSSSFLWSRWMYDWFVETGVPAKTQGHTDYQDLWPIVLDADDVVRNKAVVDKFCTAAKLDPNEVMYTWPSNTEEDIKNAGLEGQFLGTLMASSGIKKDLHDHDIDISKEERKWKDEFGEEIATKMRTLVDKAMDDYEYLRSKRLRAGPPKEVQSETLVNGVKNLIVV